MGTKTTLSPKRASNFHRDLGSKSRLRKAVGSSPPAVGPVSGSFMSAVPRLSGAPEVGALTMVPTFLAGSQPSPKRFSLLVFVVVSIEPAKS